MKKKKFSWKMSAFSIAALILMLGIFFFGKHFSQRELFTAKNSTTLYAQTNLGEEPKLDFAEYFSDKDYDYEEFTTDFSSCDLNTPGTYELPVYYKGELTRCTIQLKVKGNVSGGKAVGKEITDSVQK